MASWANSEQNDYMASLGKLAPEQKCWCGWDLVGKCYNCKAYPDKTTADKMAVWCPECHSAPSSPDRTAVTHRISCSRSLACKLPWKWDNQFGCRVTEVPEGQNSPMDRADGNCICPDCGDPYNKHPMASAPLDWRGQPFLNVLCSGELVKL